MQVLNHGMGFMTVAEHESLLRSGALVCRGGHGEPDSIVCDYPKLMIETRGIIESMDLGGDMVAIQGEMAKAQREHKRSWIEYFPRAYERWHERRYTQPTFN